jgi:hypothetical protein
MTVPDTALATIRRFCEKRTRPEFRDEMQLEATTRGNSVTIAECRPPWDGSPGEWSRQPLAQLRYAPDSGEWTLYWADRNDRWHRYEELEPSRNLGVLIREIDEDPTCIFFG